MPFHIKAGKVALYGCRRAPVTRVTGTDSPYSTNSSRLKPDRIMALR
jgi:hypothetical protein